MIKDTTVRVSEVFYSLQGEGRLLGIPMHFLRLAGCTVTSCFMHPKWKYSGGLQACDTDLSTKRTPTARELLEEILLQLRLSGAHDNPSAIRPRQWVCITGGEPCAQPAALSYLCEGIQESGARVCLQTSGTLLVPCNPDWLVVSPKVSASGLTVRSGDELKLVYNSQVPSELDAFHKLRFSFKYLMPFWNPVRGPNTEATARAVMDSEGRGRAWRMTSQAHKTWGVR